MATGTIQSPANVHKKRLWTNNSPSSDFAAQNIGVNLTDYDQVEIIARYGTGNVRKVSVTVPVGDTATILLATNFDSGTAYLVLRTATTSTSGVTFNSSYRRALNSSSAASASNSYCIPTEIYGIKGIT